MVCRFGSVLVTMTLKKQEKSQFGWLVSCKALPLLIMVVGDKNYFFLLIIPTISWGSSHLILGPVTLPCAVVVFNGKVCALCDESGLFFTPEGLCMV